jgi:hypothetical protein
VAALAATHIEDAELARLARNVEDEARLLSDPAAFSAADVEFHEAIIEACNNPFLQSVAGSLYMLGKKSRSITSRIPSTLERSLQDHRDILAALKAHNPHQASEAMRNHLLRVRDACRSAGRSQNESVHDSDPGSKRRRCCRAGPAAFHNGGVAAQPQHGLRCPLQSDTGKAHRGLLMQHFYKPDRKDLSLSIDCRRTACWIWQVKSSSSAVRAPVSARPPRAFAARGAHVVVHYNSSKEEARP